MTKQKLELTWIGKGEQEKIEPRILLHDSTKDYGDTNTENMLIHGDNLLALKALEQQFAGKVKCIYIDPPYNTGSAFEHYDDNLEHSTWLNLMYSRLVVLRNLLAEDGSIFIQIDDEEYAYLKVLMDEIFGRNNYINTISVLMKNIAGASGGGEDKRLKKNIEFILIYAKDYNMIEQFTPIYAYSPIIKLIEKYRENGKSWKYTTALINPGRKNYIGSTSDGDGNEIKIFERTDYVIKPISKIMKEENISEERAYLKYAKCIFQTTMPQSSIRPRVMKKVQEIGAESDLFSIEYVPKTGRNKGQIYEQFYKGSSFRLFAWLWDVAEEKNGNLYKKELQGTYWDFVGETKNLTKEGNVEFPNGKKAEKILNRVLTLASNTGDLVLDSFLGSGTTAAVAHKMGRRWIGIELGEHCYTHCKPRLDRVIDGTDNGGITKAVNWQGGGGYKFYELAPTLIVKDKHGLPIFSEQYDAEMLTAAVAKINGFVYAPNSEVYWQQGYSQDKSYIYITTNYFTADMLDDIAADMDAFDKLLVCAPAFDAGLNQRYDNISVRKIPDSVLQKCRFGRDNYNLNIVNPPELDEEDWEDIDND